MKGAEPSLSSPESLLVQPLLSWTIVKSGLYDRGVVCVELVSENNPSGDGGESTSAPESIDR